MTLLTRLDKHTQDTIDCTYRFGSRSHPQSRTIIYIIVNSSTVTDSPLANATWPIERADERRQRCRCDAVNSQSAAGPADTKDAESKRLLRP